MTDQSYLHGWHHDDYAVAKQHIAQQLGDYDNEVKVFGRQVLCAVYIRPTLNPRTGVHATDKHQQEDIWQGKVLLVLKCGPDAFQGDAGYVTAMFGGPDDVPKPGDWLMANANTGLSLNVRGEGGTRVVERNRRDEEEKLYPFDGWACRIVPDDLFIGAVLKPHVVV